MKKHLLEGVKKGALNEAQVEQKFNKWLQDKEGKILGKHDHISNESSKQTTARLKAETAAKEAFLQKKLSLILSHTNRQLIRYLTMLLRY